MRLSVLMPADGDRPAIPGPLRESRVVAVARHLDAAVAVPVGAALARGGVPVMEVTLNEPRARALAAIDALVRSAPSSGAVVGAGTVSSIEAAEQAVERGAAFIVMPHVDVAIVDWCVTRGVPCFPGALTPTEVLAAWRAGASAVKLFPAATVGPGYIAQLRGPFPEIPLLPTGGVTADDAGAWIAAGAIAVGLGSWLIGEGDPAAVEIRARATRAAVDRAARPIAASAGR
jgi:2-dehydro-3-deoxyphosphogluconate aldolase/(4S)-4-hydroxy-2-oxoglutarate aldolase